MLAAGAGRRLGALGVETPKWLLKVHGATLAERHLNEIHRAVQVVPGCEISTRVVIGHEFSAVERFLADSHGPNVKAIYNPEYAVVNNWYSLLLGLQSITLTLDDTVIVVNSDLLAPQGWMTQFILDSHRTSSNSLIAVDLQRRLTDESMKISAVHSEVDDRLILKRIGKVGIEQPVGEYIGMLMMRGPTLTMLRASLESFLDHTHAADEWYERAIDLTANEGATWTVWPTPTSNWVEIDNDQDYISADEIIE